LRVNSTIDGSLQRKTLNATEHNVDKMMSGDGITNSNFKSSFQTKDNKVNPYNH